MGDYMGQRIIDGAYTYDFVITKRPDLKGGIDNYLTAQGHTDLIGQTLSTEQKTDTANLSPTT